MTWLGLSLREWQRRPVRNLITTAGVAIAIATLFSLVAFERGYRRGVQLELDRLGAHVLVVPKGCPYDAASIALHGATWPCYLKAEYLTEVRATPGVAAAAPALMSAFYDTNGQQTVYVGVDTNLLLLKPGWRINGAFPSQPGELLVGSEVAKRFGWRMRDQVQLPGLHTLPGQGTIAGILSPVHGPDDTFIFLRLEDAQRFLRRPGQLTHILVRLADPNNLEDVVRQLRGCDAGLYMNVVPMAHLFRTIRSVLSSTRMLLVCVAAVGLLAAGAGVSNTLLMAVAERTREIGLLRALGASSRQIFGIFWLQTVQFCVAGALVGVTVAFLGSRLIERWLRGQLPFAPSSPLIRWEGIVVIGCVAAAVALGTVAGLLPACRACRLSPVEAMRKRGGQF